MSDLKALSDAATQGRWTDHRNSGLSVYMWHGDNTGGRHIADTGRISSDSPAHIIAEDKANASFIAALVNAYRAGTLVDATQARKDTLQEAADATQELAISSDNDVEGAYNDGLTECHNAITSLMKADT